MQELNNMAETISEWHITVENQEENIPKETTDYNKNDAKKPSDMTNSNIQNPRTDEEKSSNQQEGNPVKDGTSTENASSNIKKTWKRLKRDETGKAIVFRGTETRTSKEGKERKRRSE